MKIALIGYGKMGREIDALAGLMGHEVVLRYKASKFDKLEPGLLSGADVAIEFSVPEAAYDNIVTCIQAGVPVVCGTTGWLQDIEKARAYAQKENGALLYASNFSIGVNIFFAANRYLARIMDAQPQYQVAMKEIHHTEKKDAPSGTALSLANDILGAIQRKTSWTNEPATSESQLEIISERSPGVPGSHIINYSNAIDQIQISHVAHSREGFVRGALLAAEWIIGKNGCFDMSDVLEI